MLRWCVLFLIIGFGLSACADGAGAPSGPSVSVVNTCLDAAPRGGNSGSVGDTVVNVNVDCPKDSQNATAPPVIVPGS